MENPTLVMHSLYYAMCLLNFVAALWMAAAITRMRETDLWPFRAVITLAGLMYAIVAVSMFKYPEYAREGASTLIWWWAIGLIGLLVMLQPLKLVLPSAVRIVLERLLDVNIPPELKLVPPSVVRIATYVGAVLAFWGEYLVFTEQPNFSDLATYYGFFGANLAAAVWIMGMALSDDDMVQRKRAILMGTGVIYAGLVVAAVETMQMVLESPY